jgi:hypothetical protein
MINNLLYFKHDGDYLLLDGYELLLLLEIIIIIIIIVFCIIIIKY